MTAASNLALAFAVATARARVRAARMSAADATEWSLGDAVLAALRSPVPVCRCAVRINGNWRVIRWD